VGFLPVSGRSLLRRKSLLFCRLWRGIFWFWGEFWTNWQFTN